MNILDAKNRAKAVTEIKKRSSYSSKKIYLVNDEPGYLLIDFVNCNYTQYEIFKIDNIPKSITELEKFVHIGKFLDEYVGSIPKIYAHSDDAIVLQNLGNDSLQKLALSSAKYGILRSSLNSAIDWIVKLYKVTIDQPNSIIVQRTFETRAILGEMENFVTHCLTGITDTDRILLLAALIEVADTICKETCLIHRDFQSANLIYHNEETYVIDFQDACIGPRFYDLASLLVDVKICLPPNEIKMLVKRYFIGIGIDQYQTLPFYRELSFNCIIRICKSLTIRYKNYRQTNDKKILAEINQGIYILKTILLSINRLGYLGRVSTIINKYLDTFEKNNLQTIILGAGQGKRMGGDQPKVLVECLDIPMLDYSLRNAVLLNSDQIYLVVGYKKELIQHHINHYYRPGFVTCVTQEQQLGTGHAVKQVTPHLEGFSGTVLIVAGDVPVLSKDTLDNFVDSFRDSDFDAGILTTVTEVPKGYGRIIRDSKGKFVGTIEQKDIPDTKPELEQIKEISTGTIVFKAPVLLDKITLITNDNAQDEYYLPDVINLLLKEGRDVMAYNRPEIPEIHGANNREQLAEIEQWMNTF